MKIQHAAVSFNSHGTLISEAFDDVYYSNDDGIAETQYVFIDGNQLKQKWLNHKQSTFVIGETGFGTGLNIMLVLQQFKQFRTDNPDHDLTHLHVISFEKYPLAQDILNEVAAQRPSLEAEYNALIDIYPPALSGHHRLDLVHFSSSIDLILGDINESIEEVYAYESGNVDAWFLDGFAPSKNESMWQQRVFSNIARLSKVGASFATFTAAGAVKRGLQAAGFEITKRKGYGRKREMLVGTLIEKQSVWTKKQPPWFTRDTGSSEGSSKTHPASKKVVIVGGGLAGATSSLELLRAGFQVTLVCADEAVARGASGNKIGGFYPQLQAEAGISSQFYAHSFLFARHWYDQLNEQQPFEHDWCGVIQLGFNDNTRTRFHKMQQKDLWPDSFARVINTQEASEKANISLPFGGLYIPNAGWISPKSLTEACIASCHHYEHFNLLTNTSLQSYYLGKTGSPIKSTCRNDTDQDLHVISDYLVIAAAAGSSPFLSDNIPLRLTRGQVEYVKSTDDSAALNTVLCHKGYFTPAVDGRHALGSTYHKNERGTDYRLSDRDLNLHTHTQAMQDTDFAKCIDMFAREAEPIGRAAIRCSTPDHMPIIGNMPDFLAQEKQYVDLYKHNDFRRYRPSRVQKNVFLLTGLGSRGLTTAPILARTLRAQITQSCLPLPNSLLKALQPNRYKIRQWLTNK
ncbi:bifunctional tRNA (5-methylaminomethyl-2-thiouridine)(34)-methyltransferase MnmD/FAD-dependent 5-carboxymethylaminomethyl-2-thiouridine(34) oxidoreductase MnmC [Agaribacter flavus]|uniref:tRNA 5-methylaminomethyl-2-thiouridine biosynthesis bifunctional protein MnmC n=1 Tax=Agaribacter flavus TaxID=1902781 RepID=A0ABV7FME7_9ALTE